MRLSQRQHHGRRYPNDKDRKKNAQDQLKCKNIVQFPLDVLLFPDQKFIAMNICEIVEKHGHHHGKSQSTEVFG